MAVKRSLRCGSLSRFATCGSDRGLSGEGLVDHFAVDVRQPPLDAVVVVRQLLMIKAEQVEHGGVEVLHLEKRSGGGHGTRV